jgi:catechol 2,3-dioxygenase-like lactoylglutathione lyase family enzyme
LISLRRIDHVALRVADVDEAAPRWAIQFGLTERSRDGGRALLSCDDEPYALELIEGGQPGHDHTGFELRRSCTLEDAKRHLDAHGVAFEEREGCLFVADPDGNGVQLMPHREQIAFYTDVLGMRLTDYLGDGGAWLHINADHHVMALIDKGYAHLHHVAFDVVDIGQMRAALDHLGRHGRWLGWGPTRHGVGGNIASYVRIVEEECFVELYCDMEQLEAEHSPRVYPDNRYSSNTWGPLPPRSYFRFDAEAIASERESLEMIA